jgi:hypothetical protein
MTAVFRPVLKGSPRGSPLQPEALSAHSVAQFVKAYAARAGLDPASFAGHSLRSGFLTSAASVLKMVEIGRHKSVDMLTTYVRRPDLFREHATGEMNCERIC